MFLIWRNPEFVRYVRSDLRPWRGIAATTLVVCVLVALACFASDPNATVTAFFRLFHQWLAGIQFTLLLLWCISACAQGISGERLARTYDFWRTTRLTPAELTIGKIAGAPVMAYFVFACTLPISFGAGILGGFRPDTLLLAYGIVILFAAFLSLVALWASMIAERTSPGAIGLLIVLLIALSWSFIESPARALSAMNPAVAILDLYGFEWGRLTARPTLFGVTVPFSAMAVILLSSFGAWIALMVVRNIKKDLDRIQLLSRWQAVGFASFLNGLFYAMIVPSAISNRVGSVTPQDVALFGVFVNMIVLYAIGLSTLTPYEKLKMWARRRADGKESYFSTNGLPWPWLATAAVIAYGLFVVEGEMMSARLPIDALEAAAIKFAIVLIFVTRDILFLQWCVLVRMKRPLGYALLYLGLYYTAIGIAAAVVNSMGGAWSAFAVGMTPVGAFAELKAGETIGLAAGVVVQLLIIAGLLQAISVRLRRTATSPPAADANVA